MTDAAFHQNFHSLRSTFQTLKIAFNDMKKKGEDKGEHEGEDKGEVDPEDSLKAKVNKPKTKEIYVIYIYIMKVGSVRSSHGMQSKSQDVCSVGGFSFQNGSCRLS